MLSVQHVHKRFGEHIHALRDVSLEVAPREVVALLGPSGCGKTTLLRIIAGLEEMDSGSITLDGSDLTRIAIHRRNFGFMFQDFALFPHQSVAENIAFGLRMRNDSPSSIRTRVEEMLELVNLPGYGDRSIFELSGGERQRVALARSLAPNPRLLMLDEPLGSLDRNLRESLALELRAILRAVGVTSIYVTHDQQEALAMSDRLVIMNRGQIEQIDAPEVVYRRPATEFVARFLGFRNLIPITRVTEDGLLQTPLGSIPAPANTPEDHDLWMADGGPRVALLIRPESARLAPEHLRPAPMTSGGGNSADGRRRTGLRSALRGQTESPTTPDATPNVPIHPDYITIQGKLVSSVFLGVDYRVVIDVASLPTNQELKNQDSGSATTQRMYFDLPSHQTDMEHGTLRPVTLPPIDSRVTLHLFPDLMSVIQVSKP